MVFTKDTTIATSSGNHGKALSWAAQRAGVPATIVMPADAYPNKIAACRELGAEVVLGDTPAEAEAICAERVAAGARERGKEGPRESDKPRQLDLRAIAELLFTTPTLAVAHAV